MDLRINIKVPDREPEQRVICDFLLALVAELVRVMGRLESCKDDLPTRDR